MTALLALCLGATVFTSFLAKTWLVRSRREQTATAMLDRLGVAPAAPLFRHGGRLMPLLAILEQSGLPWTLSGLATRVAGAALLTGLAGGLALGSVGVVMLAPTGPLVVYLHLARHRQQRLWKINSQMPRVLQLLALALRAGQSLPRAIALVARESPDPAAQELRRASNEEGLGRPIEEALVALNARLPDCTALRMLVTSLLVLRRTGGNMVEVLERINEVLQAQVQYRQRLRSATAEGRWSGRMLVALPVFFLVPTLFINPGYLRGFFEDGGGQTLALAAFVLWAVGAVWVRHLCRPQI